MRQTKITGMVFNPETGLTQIVGPNPGQIRVFSKKVVTHYTRTSLEQSLDGSTLGNRTLILDRGRTDHRAEKRHR